MKKILLSGLISGALALTSQSFAAEDFTSLWKPVARGALSDDSIYFVMTDRFENGNSANDEAGIGDGRLGSGYDPTDIGYYHGGDFLGLTQRLEYIKGLGFTSIWITPPVVNRPMQGDSASYHGYWGTDFTTIDPHLGTEAEFKAFVSRAHSLGMKVIVDIVVNHTADVISPKIGIYSYRDTYDYPYRDSQGKIFDASKVAGLKSFPKLDLKKSFPYEPFVSNYYKNIKKPAWLNDPRNYHNRGDSTFSGESSTFGDFFGLDDLFTERPEVVQGWVQVWSDWITKFDIDGYRVDTAKHVNPEFWKVFLPQVLKAAKAAGKSEFPIFGEVADGNPKYLATFTMDQKFPSVLDFAFQSEVIGFTRAPNQAARLIDLFNADDAYTTASTSAYGIPTFLGNHDMGRTGMYLERVNFGDGPEALLARGKIAHTALFLMRGSPTLYYGDEKGMTGSGGDKEARQDMFATQVEAWKSELRIGSTPIGDRSAFDVKNPLEEHIASLNQLRRAHPALSQGTQQIRIAEKSTFAYTRYFNNQEYVVIFNTSEEALSSKVKVSTVKTKWEVLFGAPSNLVSGVNEVTVTVPPVSAVVLKAEEKFVPVTPLSITLRAPKTDFSTENWEALTASVPGDDYVEVTFAVRQKGKNWRVLGTADRRTLEDYNTPAGLFRVYLQPRQYKSGTQLEILAVAKGADGKFATSKIRNFTIKY